MLRVTKHQLFQFAAYGEEETHQVFLEFVSDVKRPLARAKFEALKKCDLKRIVAGSEMSENHLGGDNLVDVADGVLAAVAEGYAICTWYGPKTEAMVVGYRTNELAIAQ
jgi:hypothetical protein